MHTWRRIAGAYTLDLAVSVSLVLVALQLSGAVSGTGHDSVWLDSLRDSVSRFTPFGLWHVYRDQAMSALASLDNQTGNASVADLMAGVQMLLQLVLAAPDTLLVIWQQTQSASDWVTLVCFAGTMGGSFAMLATGRRLTLVRLLLAALSSPVLAIGLFWMTQHTLLELLSGVGWFTAGAPWLILCPIACTLYWALFPHAEEPAVVAVLHRLGRIGLAPRRQHSERLSHRISTMSRSRR